MSESNAPVDDRGQPVTITISHLNPTARLILLACMVFGIGGGGWHIIGQAQQAISPSGPVVEMRLQSLEHESAMCSARLEILDQKIDVLTQIAAASYVAATVDDPGRQTAGKAAADTVKRKNGELLRSRDPLKLLSTP